MAIVSPPIDGFRPSSQDRRMPLAEGPWPILYKHSGALAGREVRGGALSLAKENSC